MTGTTTGQIHGFHHVGLTVPNIEAAVGFFVDGLDCELLFSTEPGSPVGPEYADALNIPVGSRNAGMALLRSAGAILELFEYEVEGQIRSLPRNCDYGGYHLAFHV
ncbi:MAG: VOC family protein, partial [Pseudomonadota bacterium]